MKANSRESDKKQTSDESDGLLVLWGDGGLVSFELDDVESVSFVDLNVGVSLDKDGSAGGEGSKAVAAVGIKGPSKVSIAVDDEGLLEATVAAAVRSAEACCQEKKKKKTGGEPRKEVGDEGRKLEGGGTGDLGRNNGEDEGKGKDLKHRGFALVSGGAKHCESTLNTKKLIEWARRLAGKRVVPSNGDALQKRKHPSFPRFLPSCSV